MLRQRSVIKMADKRTNEREAVTSLYDNLTPFTPGPASVWVMNHGDGMRYLTVAVASDGGDAGGARQTSSEPHRLFPGLNRVQADYWGRVEGDADRQRQRAKAGGVLSMMLDSGKIEAVKDIGKLSTDKIDGWLARSSDLQIIGDLRSHAKHGEAARKHFDAWHTNAASEQVKRNRHFWAMATDSRKVA
jgi:hypothetical protein